MAKFNRQILFLFSTSCVIIYQHYNRPKFCVAQNELEIHNLRTVIVTADIHQGLYSTSP